MHLIPDPLGLHKKVITFIAVRQDTSSDLAQHKFRIQELSIHILCAIKICVQEKLLLSPNKITFLEAQ